MFSNLKGQIGIPFLTPHLENNPEGFLFPVSKECPLLSEMCKFRKILFSVSLVFWKFVTLGT